jgi:S1-C subfamily serine protease
MKRIFQALVVSLACGTIALGGLVYSFPVEQTGCFGPSSRIACIGSGVYIGRGLVLTNQHIAVLLSEQSSFWVPAWKYVWRTIGVDVEQAAFLDRDMELGIVKLKPSMLDLVGVVTPCLSTRAVKQGEMLTVTSSAYGKFPPVLAALVISDARPLMRLDPSPRGESPYSAMTVIATLSADQATLVGPGSSGGPVLNGDGGVVGLVWTGRKLEDGSGEVWITPVSSWLRRIQEAELPKDVLGVILGTRCTYNGHPR